MWSGIVLILVLGQGMMSGVAAVPTPQRAMRTRRWADESIVWDHINHGEEILGVYEPCTYLCNWMSKFADDTPLVSMNFPGTHDTATWNYTEEVQERYSELTVNDIGPAIQYQCQDQSIIQALNHGIRAFDLRIGFSPLDNQTIIFYHGSAILSVEATLEDILYGYYKFLDDNPSETIMLSIKLDNSTWGTPEAFQSKLYDLIFSEPASSYFSQVNGSLPTLGDVRGKINLLRRFDTALLSTSQSNEIGIDLKPSVFLDNEANFTIEYATDTFAYVEDYYEIGGPGGVDSKDTWKFNATSDHLDFAANEHPDSLFITFSSAEKNDEGIHPIHLALGNGSIPGVNQRLLPWLQDRKGQRRGIVFMDWWAQVPGLVEAVIGL